MSSAAAMTIFFIWKSLFKISEGQPSSRSAVRLTIGWREHALVKSTCRISAGGQVLRGYFDAVLLVMLTTWTRRLTGSIGAFASFGLVSP